MALWQDQCKYMVTAKSLSRSELSIRIVMIIKEFDNQVSARLRNDIMSLIRAQDGNDILHNESACSAGMV